MTVTPLRLVSWNVCDAFTRKFGHLERLKPDVAILQEVRPECLTYAGLDTRSLWIGTPGQKGMAIIAYGEWSVSAADVAIPDERWFLPAVLTRGSERVHVVGVWVDSMGRNLTAVTLSAVDVLSSFLQQAPAFLAGDFNQTVRLDAGKSAARRFSTVLDGLEALGLSSAWHLAHDERQGEETSATLFWTWNEARPYHIDFAFGSAALSLRNATLGGYDLYFAGRISDHVPLTVDYELQQPT